MEEQIKNFILIGEFLAANELINKIGDETLENILFEIGYGEESICAYAFICFLLLKNETVSYHCLASEILIHAFVHIGGYAAALYHTKRAIVLAPDDMSLKEMLLFFHNVPEKLVSREEAIQVAREILKKNPDSSHAKTILSEEKL